MILDTSAIVAILRDEPEAKSFANAIASTTSRLVSAVNYVGGGSRYRSSAKSGGEPAV